MTINAGVWIDHHKAVVVHLTNGGEGLRQILSDAGSASPTNGEGKGKNSYTPNDYVAEDKRERKATSHLNQYYDQVIACLHDADAILILGPGEAKGELKKRLEDKKHKGDIAELKTVDRLTDPQIAECVRRHYQQTTHK